MRCTAMMALAALSRGSRSCPAFCRSRTRTTGFFRDSPTGNAVRWGNPCSEGWPSCRLLKKAFTSRSLSLHDGANKRDSKDDADPAGRGNENDANAETEPTTKGHSSTQNYNNLPRLYVGSLPEEPIRFSSGHDFVRWIARSRNKPLSLLHDDAVVPLSPEQSHYLTTVLRLGGGRRGGASRGPTHQVRLFDGSGEEWLAELLLDDDAEKGKPRKRRDSTVTALCLSRLRRTRERNFEETDCWLCVAPPKKNRLQWMIEKTAEMDCTGYILLDTEFSQNVKKRSKGTPATRLPAFNKLQMYTMEAAEQCERLNLPQFVTIQTPHVSQTAPSSPNRSVDGDPAANVLFQEPKSRESKQETSTETTSLLDFLQAWLEPGTTSFDGNVKLLACRERANGIPVWEALESIFDGENEAADETAPSTVIFLIGPEGGWSPSEEAMMDQLERSRPNSFVNVSLGPTVLRTETAAMFAMATYSLYNDYHRRQRRKKSNAL